MSYTFARKSIYSLVAIALCGTGLLLQSTTTLAQQMLLTRAVVQSIRNQVQLMPQNQSPRLARISDTMSPGDALATAASSLAELRFNDGSLARVGERAVFRFSPKTRNFQLSNGTALLLIPPKRGRTRLSTPNASAAIRGSALFARYDAATDTTTFGVLTNNPEGPIVILTENGTQQPLYAGEMAVVVKDRVERVYQFDLGKFYESSELVKGLNLNQTPSEQELTGPDAGIAAVRSETTTALKMQLPFTGAAVIENPAFVKLSTENANLPIVELANTPRLLGDETFAISSRLLFGPLGNGLGDIASRATIESLLNNGEIRVNSTVLAIANPNRGTAAGNSSSNTGTSFPGGGNTDGVFPGGGATNGVFPGGGATNGVFPGGGATNGVFPGGGATNGVFPGGGNTDGVFPGGGATNGVFPGGGATNGMFPPSGPTGKPAGTSQ